MNDTWPRVSLGDLIRSEKRPVKVEAELQYQEIGTYSYGRGIFHKVPRSGLEVGNKHLFLMKEGDLILQITFAWEGAIALCSKSEDGLFGSVRYATYRVDQDRCFAPFLVRYLCTREGLDQIGRICPGSAGRNRVLAIKRLSEITVPLPPIQEQHRIMSRIDELSVKIDEAKRLRIESLAELEASIVSTHLTLSAKSVSRRLNTYLALDEHSVPIVANAAYPQVGVRGFGKGLFSKPPVIGGTTTYRSFNQLYAGALVLSQVKGWEGAVAMTPDRLVGYYVSPEYRTFKCREDQCLPEYLAAIVSTKYFWGKLKDATRGVGDRRERTRPEQFLQLEFPMPQLSDQKYALELFRRLGEVRQLQAETRIEIEAMIPAILDQAFHGRL